MMNEIYDIEEAEEGDEREGLTHGSQKSRPSSSTFGIINNKPIPYGGVSNKASWEEQK